jgi:hypothetical protein
VLKYALVTILFLLVVAPRTVIATPEKGPTRERRTLRANNFKHERDAGDYFSKFGPTFVNRVLRAGPNHHLLDWGAGNMVFARQIAGLEPIPSYDHLVGVEQMRRFSSAAGPNVTGVSYLVSGPKAILPASKFNPLTGALFRDLPAESITGRFGSVHTAVDFWGVLGYTSDPSAALSALHRVVDASAQVFVLSGPRNFVRTSAMSGRRKVFSSLHASTVELTDGQTLTLPDWISTRLESWTATVDQTAPRRDVLLLRPASAKATRRLELLGEPSDHKPPHRRFREVPADL